MKGQGYVMVCLKFFVASKSGKTFTLTYVMQIDHFYLVSLNCVPSKNETF